MERMDIGGDQMIEAVGFLLGSILLLFVGISSLIYHREFREYNGGICKESGKPWVHFDSDSNGGDGFNDGAGHYLWMSHYKPENIRFK